MEHLGCCWADASTMFKESHGLLVQGAFVKGLLHHRQREQLPGLHQTVVPPGAGDRIFAATWSASTMAMSTPPVANQVWVVDGQSFQVSDATDLDGPTDW
ncbi:MAG: hypothetical protein R3A10_11400 [Caldilineaceae bacterium]